MRFFKLLATAFSFILFNTAALADFCATSKIEANVCSGFVIESCSHVKVDAIKNSEGKLFNISKCYKDVSEYSKSKGRCWINTKSKGYGLISWGIDAMTQPNFAHKNKDGKYESIDAEYITFMCKKTNY
ncbi:MAG: hypothetical protein ABGZ19_12295 [Verrucomicrobiales bacterium]